MVFASLNGQILQDLPEDRHGRYRDGPVYIGEPYEGPDDIRVPGLMDALIDWLQTSTEHPLVRAALRSFGRCRSLNRSDYSLSV